MAVLPRPRASGREEELTPTGTIRPFVVSRDLAQVLEGDPIGSAMLDLVTRLATSTTSAQQKIWTALRANDKKLDKNNELCVDMLHLGQQTSEALQELTAAWKETEARHLAEAEERKRADAELAEIVGGVLGDVSRNSSADLERDVRVRQIAVVSETALATAETAKQAIVLSPHGRRQAGIVGVVTGFFTLVTAFKEPLLAYARLRGWIP